MSMTSQHSQPKKNALSVRREASSRTKAAPLSRSRARAWLIERIHGLDPVPVRRALILFIIVLGPEWQTKAKPSEASSRALRCSDMCDCDRPRIRFWRDLRSYGKATGWFWGDCLVPYENKLCRPSLATFFVLVFWDGRAEKATRMYGKRVPFLAGAWQVVVQTRRRFPRINWILLLGEVVFANTDSWYVGYTWLCVGSNRLSHIAVAGQQTGGDESFAGD